MGLAVADSADNALDDVGDVGIVATRRSVAEDRDGTAGVDQRSELCDGQIGAIAGPEGGEESQTRDGQAVEVMEGMGQQFAGLLRGGIGADGEIDGVGLSEGSIRPVTVDAGAGGVNETGPGIKPAGGLEEVDRPQHVDLGICGRVFNAWPDPGACGQVDDRVGSCLRDDSGDRRAVADVEDYEAEAGVARGGGEVCPLHRLGIEGVEVVDDDDLAAVGQQAIDQIGADEAGPAGDQRAVGGAIVRLGFTQRRAPSGGSPNALSG